MTFWGHLNNKSTIENIFTIYFKNCLRRLNNKLDSPHKDVRFKRQKELTKQKPHFFVMTLKILHELLYFAIFF